MNKLKFFWSLVLIPLLGACRSDIPVDISEPGQEIGRDGVYMTVTLNPSGNAGTRSTTTGSNTSSDGVEVGTEDENKVNTVLIVIADKNNDYIASSIVPGTDNKGSIDQVTVAGDPLYQTTAKFNKTDIGEYYDDNKNNPDVSKIHVFAFCNPTSEFIANMNDVAAGTYTGKWYDMVYTESETDRIWNSTKGFTMSNETVAEREFPATLEEWSKYSTSATAFKLSGLNQPGTDQAVDNLTNRGSIKVHRMAARFDFRDGSQIEGLGNGVQGEPFTYAVVNNADGDNIVKCKLYAMALTNMSKTQYYLSRVSNNGLPQGATPAPTYYELCGYETSDNYVVSTNAQAKYDLIKSNFSTYFSYPFFNSEGLVASKGQGWDWKYCSEVVKGASDNYKDKSFHVWRYVMENTIPTRDKQVNSQSTGVIFKSRMLPTSVLNKETATAWEKELYEALAYANNGAGSSILKQNPDTDPILYSLAGNTLYVTWENVQQAALNAAGFNEQKSASEQNLDRKAPLYLLCFGSGGYGTVKYGDKTFTDDLDEDPNCANVLWKAWEEVRAKDPDHVSATTQSARTIFKKKATELGFTLYQSSQDSETGEWGYYCYYYYWNRHNNNGIDGTMGRMEFAVVRNNVYKLTVTKLNTLGHPRIPENDPDTPTPDTPDESSEIYMSVSVEVLPWVVRLNDIEF